MYLVATFCLFMGTSPINFDLLVGNGSTLKLKMTAKLKTKHHDRQGPGPTYSKRLPTSVTPLLHITDFKTVLWLLSFFSVILRFLSDPIPLCLPTAPLRRFLVLFYPW
jgi:hypothetical protein